MVAHCRERCGVHRPSACGMKGAHEDADAVMMRAHIMLVISKFCAHQNLTAAFFVPSSPNKRLPEGGLCIRHVGFDQAAVSAIVFLCERR